jgi:hypothetical protein
MLGGRHPHHVTYETLPNAAILLYALGVLGQLEWPLAGRFILGRLPPLQCVLLVGGSQRVQTPLQNAAPRPQHLVQFGLVGVGLAGELGCLNQIVLRLAQHLIPLGVLQPRIHLDG